jgi:hypothetical protein
MIYDKYRGKNTHPQCVKNEMTETYTTIILLVAFHGCENWSLTCREAHRLRVNFK